MCTLQHEMKSQVLQLKGTVNFAAFYNCILENCTPPQGGMGVEKFRICRCKKWCKKGSDATGSLNKTDNVLGPQFVTQLNFSSFSLDEK